MRSILLLVVAAAAPLLSSCQSTGNTLAMSSTAGASPSPSLRQEGGDVTRTHSPFTGPSLPSARFDTSKGRFGFGGAYSTSRPGSLAAAYDPENFLLYSSRCMRYCHYGSSYCYRGSYCGYGYGSGCGGGYSRGCRY